MKVVRRAANLSLGPASSVVASEEPSSPAETIWTTCMATGASRIEAACTLWQTREPSCVSRALAEMQKDLRGEALKTDRRTSESGLRFLLAKLYRLDSEFAEAAWAGAEGLRVRGNLDLSGWQIRAIPKKLVVMGDLDLSDNEPLTVLASGLKVGGECQLQNCTSLKVLPKNLQVGFRLNLFGCSSLESLPVGLSVADDLSLLGCTAWDGHLPERTRVGGRIYTPVFQDGVTLEQWGEPR